MVNCLAELLTRIPTSRDALLFAAVEQAEPLIVRLDPERRAKVLLALFGIVLAGFAIVGLAWLGGRCLRRMVAKPAPAARRLEEAWYRKPLVPSEPGPSNLPDSK